MSLKLIQTYESNPRSGRPLQRAVYRVTYYPSFDVILSIFNDRYIDFGFRDTHNNLDSLIGESSIFNVPTLTVWRTVRELKKIMVNEKEALGLAKKALQLRWDKREYKVDPSCLIQPQFPQHTAFNAYNVYQCVLYNLTQGGEYTAKRLGEGRTNPVRKVRKLTHIGEVRRISKELWQLTKSWVESFGETLPK